ncbi:hypothetical protein SLV14_000108 [Streptomyces sp. Je 1-4]|uniref:hypothetical protein n=1 Tax=Streptomyces TaxID=1883 RepID=UPI00140F00D3|nr:MULTISPECIES: hypothetical protein [unclassified Streptomyces]QIK10823.1 hypothetical protein G7Z12_36930 [Streptomyces sp. ID38640]UYB37824.1 hypothetical protein SLV14_000108 [Streptomyces sp. Je 1-4]UZQ33743.1 hypothetical protein SLV14N_000108 [Streptomyces sp. Je 1-4] [Streptomyces sp. Je 1-4 4N24]UZQ41161.1 hypothetical protein SLV14NA_000108 [Streptomyces sp. Je 1-4] [Streptomyces sp. Je 1-4 4N24_ara]
MRRLRTTLALTAALAATIMVSAGPAHAGPELRGTWYMGCVDDAKTLKVSVQLKGSGKPYDRHKLRISLLDLAADGRNPSVQIQTFNRDGSLTNYRRRQMHGGKGTLKRWYTSVQQPKKGISHLWVYATSRNSESHSCTDSLPE